jgi:hypothetical protein
VERALIDRLGTLAMTWPLRGLELVLYTRAAVADPARVDAFTRRVLERVERELGP